MSFQALTFGAMHQTLSQILFETVFKTRDFKRNAYLDSLELIGQLTEFISCLLSCSNSVNVTIPLKIRTHEKVKHY